jgi:hypothetical protein
MLVMIVVCWVCNCIAVGGPGVRKSMKRQQEPDKSGPTAKRQTLTAVSDPLVRLIWYTRVSRFL